MWQRLLTVDPDTLLTYGSGFGDIDAVYSYSKPYCVGQVPLLEVLARIARSEIVQILSGYIAMLVQSIYAYRAYVLLGSRTWLAIALGLSCLATGVSWCAHLAPPPNAASPTSAQDLLGLCNPRQRR